MKPSALLYYLWPKNISVLDEYLALHPTNYVLTAASFHTSELEQIAKNHSTEIVVLDQLITDGAIVSIKQELAGKLKQINAMFDTQEWTTFCKKHGLGSKSGSNLLGTQLADRLLSEMVLIQSLEDAKEQFSIEIFVTNEDVTRLSRTMTEWTKINDIPSLHVTHSAQVITPYSVHKTFHTDYIAVYGENVSDILHSIGVNHERIHVTGNPAWDTYPSILKNRAELRQNIIEHFNFSSEFPIIVFGTTWSAKLSAFSDQKAHEKSLRSFFKGLKLLDDSAKFNIIIKDRPSNIESGEQFIRQLALEENLNNQNIRYTTENTEILMATCDLVVSFDSSLSVEAMICNTPAINLTVPNNIVSGLTFNGDDGLIHIVTDDSSGLSKAILKLLFDKSFREELKARFREIVPKYNLSSAGDAAKNVALLMDSISIKSSPYEQKYPWQLLSQIDDNPIEEYYHTTPRMELIQMFEHDPKIYLEIGCGAGATIKVIKEVFPDAMTIGIELNKNAADFAKRYGDIIIDKPFEEIDLTTLKIKKHSIDTVILADVLEHMYNPWGTLIAIKPYLSSNAQILASIPNVRNLWLLNELMEGRWRYEQAGLLDVTHIRFFTKKEVIDLFEQTGYSIQDIKGNKDGRVNITSTGNSFSVDMEKWSINNVSPQEAHELSTLQFLVRAQPRDNVTDATSRSFSPSVFDKKLHYNQVVVAKKKMAYLADPFDTDNYLDLTLNILSPISNLKDYAIEPLLQKSNGRYHIKTELLASVHVVIVYDKGAYLSHLIPQIQACGIPVLFYIHTDVWNVDVKHAQKEALDLLQRHYQSAIGLCDTIVTSNEYLSRNISKHSEVITPLVDISPWNEPNEPWSRYSEKFTVGVYVTMDNLNDISMITKFIQTIQKKYVDELYFVVHAINCPSSELEALSFVDVRSTKIDNYLQYINFIRSQPIDAVLVPLIANTHNLTISPLNYFIHSLCEVPGVYSNWGLHKEVIEHGVTGFLCDENELEWEAAIVTLMRYPDTREKMAQEAKKQVLQNFTTDHGLRQTYDLLERFEAPSALREIPESLKQPFTRYELSSYLNYPLWCDIKALQPIDIHLWERLSQEWNQMDDFHFFVEADETNLDDLADTIESLVSQLYPQWNLYIIAPIASPNPLFDAHDKLHWIQMEGSLFSAVNYVSTQLHSGFIGFLNAGDKLQPHALVAFNELYNHAEAHLIYCDHDLLNEHKIRIHPQFKPDFNLDMFRSKDYISRSFVISAVALKALEGIRLELSDGELYDLILRFHDAFGEDKIGHYGDILYSLVAKAKEIDLQQLSSKIALKHHLVRNGYNADVIDEVDNSFRILYYHDTKPLVSIIIPTKNQVHFLRPCIETLLEKTSYENFEIIIVDNQSNEMDAKEYLKQLGSHEKIKVIHYNKPFNYSEANNIGAQHASGEFLLLLNNDTEILHENWLDVLLSYGQRDDIGIVGPRLIYPNQTIQHAGVIVGLNGIADHQFSGADLSDPGYMSRLQIDQNLSAVTAAVMLIKRSAFDAVGGLNQSDYSVNYSDIDFCLKVVKSGYKIVFTPHATLLHYGSVTQKNIDIKKIKERTQRFAHDQHTFKTLWGEMILHDPAYNTNLDTADSFMSIRTQALAHWNPLLKSPIPKIFGMARGKDGGGFYRLTSPLYALQSAGLAQTHYEYKNFMTSYIMMQQPDIIIYQTPLHDNMLRFLELIKTYYPRVTLIYEIDDLLTNIPIDNRAFHSQYKDTAKRLQKGLKYCDRLVVSTQPLKEAFKSYSDDIRIIPNYLPKAIWENLHSKRNRSDKLRVGWAGSIFHKGDLALISKLVEKYHDAVEWVFFGMAPEGLEEKIEFHSGVSLELYPEKLSSLDLDLALVPLEDNAFNAAKSNLRLLEFGILGWPVICSDVYPYKDAPVTRVKNRYKDWEKAFLAKIADINALKNEGDQLKKWVEDNYILEDHVDFIYQQYTKPIE